jgi:hypothetical protein
MRASLLHHREIHMRRARLFVLLLPAFACAHGAGRPAPDDVALDAAPDSEPTPILACTEAVLAGSPLVARYSDRRQPRSRGRWFVVLRNPPGPHATGFGLGIRGSRDTPRELVAAFPWPGTWMGEGGMKPQSDQQTYDTEGEMLRDVAVGLLQAVRSECAPDAPGAPACRRLAEGRSAECSVGL